jgi:homoserine acetyltransferase
MLALLNTWQKGDVSLVRHNGDYARCLGEIKAKALVMPCKTDLYFPVRLFYFSLQFSSGRLKKE